MLPTAIGIIDPCIRTLLSGAGHYSLAPLDRQDGWLFHKRHW